MSAAGWPHDEDMNFGNMLLDISQASATAMAGQAGEDTIRKWFYCPSNAYYNSSSTFTHGTTAPGRMFGPTAMPTLTRAGLPEASRSLSAIRSAGPAPRRWLICSNGREISMPVRPNSLKTWPTRRRVVAPHG